MGRPSGFEFFVCRSGDVLITHKGREAAVLRGEKAARFLSALAQIDAQALMARVTGNYKRGNERR